MSGIDRKVGDTPGDDRRDVRRESHPPVSAADPSQVRFQRIRRLRAAVRNHPPLDFTWRVGVLVLSLPIIVAGFAMLVLPGPGWAAIFVGLALLATEFEWARRILHRARQNIHAATARVRDPRTRRRMIAVSVAVLAIAGAAAWWYIARYGVNVPSWLRN